MKEDSRKHSDIEIIHLFVQQIFIAHLLYERPYFRALGVLSEQVAMIATFSGLRTLALLSLYQVI